MTFKLDRSCVTYHCIISPLQMHGENRRQFVSVFLSEREGSFLRREHCRFPAGGRCTPVSGVGSGLAVCDDTQERRAPATGPGCEPLASCSHGLANPFHSPLVTKVEDPYSPHTACLWPECPHRSVIYSAGPVWPADLLFPLTRDPTARRCHHA